MLSVTLDELQSVGPGKLACARSRIVFSSPWPSLSQPFVHVTSSTRGAMLFLKPKLQKMGSHTL